ncbi:MAG: hypothetical protein KGN34_18415 [Sphingomonadales bacterium]|nr:hypothetical protein [Sphingomonadales bacterium]
MALGSFIAESPVRFLAALGALTLTVTAFVAGNPAPKPENPWALNQAAAPAPDRLAKLKHAAEAVAERFGLPFRPCRVEPARPAGAPAHRATHLARPKALAEESLELGRRRV